MTILVENHPEFEDVIYTKMLSAVLLLLQEDTALSDFFEEIREIPSEEISNLGSKKCPSLWLYLLDDVESPATNMSGVSQVAVTVTILQLFKYGKYNDSQQQLQRRIMAYIQALIHRQINIRDEAGNQLSDTVLQFNRLEAAEIQDSDKFIMRLDCVLGGTIDQQTQQAVC